MIDNELIERNQIIVSTTLIDDVFDNLDISKQMEFFSIIIDVILESCISSKKEHKILIISQIQLENKISIILYLLQMMMWKVL